LSQNLRLSIIPVFGTTRSGERPTTISWSIHHLHITLYLVFE